MGFAHVKQYDCNAIAATIELLGDSEDRKMASITIRNLDDEVKTGLRVRAAEHHRSMEEEARVILREAVSEKKSRPRNLVEFTRECFGPLGGVDLKLPARGPMREPPDFS